jgi:hypothetical protein
MDELDQRIESLKLLQDWSKWLISLETGVCALLWPKLTEGKSPCPLYVGWLMFWASIIAAAFLLIAISFVVSQRGDSVKCYMKGVWGLAVAEHALFLAGIFFFAWRIVEVWRT